VGARRIRVAARQSDLDVEMSVRDTGIGIASDAFGKLFDAFYTTKPTGMGIGLSVSRSIIEHHRGRLWASNNQDSGATFCFSLPLAQAPGNDERLRDLDIE